MIGDAQVVKPFEIAGSLVAAGTRAEVELRPAKLPSGGWMALPVVVDHGVRSGPALWLSAAIHGDEVCGVEIIRQVLRRVEARSLAGTLIAAPVVNVPGFANGDRYMPDRRDLNRCFPGSARGSLASRFAHVFMSEIVKKCRYGIDLHTGSDHRRNLPQIRGDFDDHHTRELTAAFGAPVALHARLRDGSLREAAVRTGATTLLYEAGEAWRFDDSAIETGVAGVLRTMDHLGMAEAPSDLPDACPTVFLRRSIWARSPASGVARLSVSLGQRIERHELLGVVADATGSQERPVRSARAGVVLGRSELAVVHRGDALVHIGLTDEQSDQEIP